ncbi:MAG: hypothetical protein R3Y35_08425 [Clostridia bacterium]
MQLQESFDIIEKTLWGKLEEQEFNSAESFQDKDGKAIIFTSEMTAYSVLYNVKKKCFEFRSGVLNEDNKVDDWKKLSTWLFEMNNSTPADAQSIANDFADIAAGPKMTADVKSITKPAKKKKNEDGNIDAQFFFNRLAFVFPSLKDAMNQERIIFGKVRFATMAKEVIPQMTEDVAKQGGADFDKLCEIFSDMYQSGDLEVRGLIIYGIFNSLSNETMDKLSEKFSPDFKKLYKYSKKLKNKKIKPNKPKKRSAVVAAAIDNANKQAGK